MIIRAIGLGFLLWLAVAASFWFFGESFFNPDEDTRLITFLSAPVIGVFSTFILLKLLREAHGDEGEASIGIALPTLFLNGYAVHEFASIYRNLDPGLDGIFGAWTLLFVGSILFTGLAMTQLAAQDERV